MTQLEVINTALGSLGRDPLGDLSPGAGRPELNVSLSAHKEALLYLRARKAWTFLLQDAQLVDPEAANGSFQFSLKYRTPDNFKKAVNLFSSGIDLDNFDFSAFSLQPVVLNHFRSPGDGFIYTNHNPAYLLYTVSDIYKKVLPDGFLAALITIVKSKMAVTLSESPSVANMFREEGEFAIRVAISEDTTQARTSVLNEMQNNPVRNVKAQFRKY